MATVLYIYIYCKIFGCTDPRKWGGFSFDVGLQRMRCTKTIRQNPWSKDPYIRGSYNIYIYIYIDRERERERERGGLLFIFKILIYNLTT